MKEKKEADNFFGIIFTFMIFAVLKAIYDAVKFFGHNWSEFSGRIIGGVLMCILIYAVYQVYDMPCYFKKVFSKIMK